MDEDFCQDDSEANSFEAGRRIIHPTFGQGVVKRLIGKDKLLVDFRGTGVKKISLRFCQLKGI